MTTELHDEMAKEKIKLRIGFEDAGIPSHMVSGVLQYVMYGRNPGDFLQAVLKDRLTESYSLADEINTSCMRNWAVWLAMHCPRGMWGSSERINANIQVGGLYPICKYCHKLEKGIKATDENHCKEVHFEHERIIQL